MKRNSFYENSIISFDEESIKINNTPNKTIKYTFNNIDIDTKNYILYLNILGIFFLNFSFYYCNYSFSKINQQNYMIKNIFIIVSLFLLVTLLQNYLTIINEKEDTKKIIYSHFSSLYTSSFYFLSFYFLTYYFTPNGNDMKFILLITLSTISTIFLSISFCNYKEKEKGIIYDNIFNVFAFSISLSIYFALNIVILINTFLVVYKNCIFIFICLIISIIILTYYNDFIFSLICLVYQISLIKNFDFHDYYFLCFVLNLICFIFKAISTYNNEKFLLIPNFLKSQNIEFNKKEDEESIISAYNKQNNYYDSL